MLTLAVIADTHVPDRQHALEPVLLEVLQAARPQGILHAGDISHPGLLTALGKIAPVTAVRGNRDWAFPQLPLFRQLTLEGVIIGLAHGHGGLIHYVRDKWTYIRYGYNFDRYRALLDPLFPQAQVIVFGHTHHQVNDRVDGRLYFNPGNAYPSRSNDYRSCLGFLCLADGQVQGHLWSTGAPLPF